MEFIIPLVMSIGLITTLVLLWLGLISAPWPVLLVILIFGLILTDKLSRQISGKAPEFLSLQQETPGIETIPEKDKGFVYRGICYAKNETTLKEEAQPKKEALVGKYRGANCTYIKPEENTVAKNHTQNNTQKIKYRGVTLG